MQPIVGCRLIKQGAGWRIVSEKKFNIKINEVN